MMDHHYKILFGIFNIIILVQHISGQIPWYCSESTVYRNETSRNILPEFKIKASLPAVHQGGHVAFTISSSGTAEGAAIIGFYVQARSAQEPSKILGTWRPHKKVSNITKCDEDGDTITNIVLRTPEVTLTWNAPRGLLGRVIIRALLFDNVNVFWREFILPGVEIVSDDVEITNKECGKVSLNGVPIIVKGETSQDGQWPWHVDLYHYKHKASTVPKPMDSPNVCETPEKVLALVCKAVASQTVEQNSRGEVPLENIMKVLDNASKRHDNQFSSYGEYIAHKLSTYDNVTRANAELHISKVLFQADVNMLGTILPANAKSSNNKN